MRQNRVHAICSQNFSLLHGECKADFVLASSAQFNLVHNSVSFQLQFQCCASCVGLETACRFPSLIWIHAGQQELAIWLFIETFSLSVKCLWIECKLVTNVFWNKWKSIWKKARTWKHSEQKQRKAQLNLNAIKWFFISATSINSIKTDKKRCNVNWFATH